MSNPISGEYYILDTPPDSQFNHGWVYPRGAYLDFQVKACMEAQLLLARTPLNPSSAGYKAILGSDSNTYSS